MKSILNICNIIGFLALEVFCGHLSETPLNVIKALMRLKKTVYQNMKILHCLENYGPSSNYNLNAISELIFHVVWRNYKAEFHQHISKS